jgi:hypothetical protein
LRRYSPGLFVLSGWLLWGVPSSIGRGEPLPVEQPEQHGAAACSVMRKTRVYVGVADALGLDRYPTAASMASTVLRVVQASLCSAPGGTSRLPQLTPSLRRALASRQPIVLEQVRFADAALEHAYVLLRSNELGKPADVASADDQVWSAHLRRAQVWRVASVSDEPAPVGQRAAPL